MNPAIFTLIEQGLSLLPSLVEAGIDIAGKVKQLQALNAAAAGNTPITDAELAKIRADFDADLDAFNAPIA